MMDIEQLLQVNGIHLKSTAPGRHYATCPKCSAGRKGPHRNEKVLGITIDPDGAVHWGCNHCPWTGPEKSSGKANGHDRSDRNIYYDYVDESGNLLFQKVRTPDKRFWQQKPDGRGGWENKLGDTRKVLYRLPDVIEAIASGYTIHIVEGEKDVDRLWSLGVPATCNPDGASEPARSRSGAVNTARCCAVPTSLSPATTIPPDALTSRLRLLI